MIRPAAFLALAVLSGGEAAAAEPVELRLERLERLVEAQAARISELERSLAAADAGDQAADEPLAQLSQPASQAAVRETPTVMPAAGPSELQLFGDLRLRQEFNWYDPTAPDRSRNALRARLAALYRPSETIELGARIATGDPDDPNSTDVTLSSFADDFDVSLDQAFVRVFLDDVTVEAGKFPNPLLRTDLVWDGDVNPQGLAIGYGTQLYGGVGLNARALYFIVEESPALSGSAMVGGQVGLAVPAGDLRFAVAGSYYDYRLDRLATADIGDFRGNRLTPEGEYLSDFNLVEAIGSVQFSGFGPSWPLEFGFDYVRNVGAVGDDDAAYALSLTGGALANVGDLRLNYSHLYAERDAVLAAFSHDNIPLATGYRLHALNLDYVLSAHVIMGARFFRFRPVGDADDFAWRNRVRLELLLPF